MKKLLKWVLIVIGVLIALLIISIIAFPFVLPLEKIKDFAVAKVSETITREVKIEKVSFNIFQGIKLEKLSIGNRPGFADKPFVATESIELRYAFWPIFKRQLIIKEIRLVKPEVLVERSAAGAYNFSDLIRKKGKKVEEGRRREKKGKKAKEGFSIIVDTFSIRKGRITYVDYGTKTSSEIKNANLTVSGITLALLKPIDFKFSATATHQKREIPLSLAGKISVNLQKETINVPSLALDIAGEKANISANVSHWKTAPFVDFSISSKKLSVDPFLAIFAGVPPKGKVKPKRGELTQKVDKATAVVSPKYRAKAKIDIENLTFQKFKVDKVDLAAFLSNKQVSVDIKDISIYEGNLSGKANINLATSGLAYNLQNLKLVGFNATPFVNTLVESFLTKLPDYKDLLDKVYGRLSVGITLRGRGVEPQDIFANAVGNGSFTLTGGEIKRMKTLTEVGKAIKSTALQEDIKFKDLHAEFTLERKVVNAKDLKFESKDIKVSFNGGADFGTLNWVPGNRLTLKLSPAITKDLPKEFTIFRDKSGWLELTFEMTGSLKKPIPKPILEKPLEKAIGKLKMKIEAQKLELEQKAKEELKKKEEETKKAIEEEKRRLEEKARKKAEEEKRRLEEEAKKKLKEMIKF